MANPSQTYGSNNPFGTPTHVIPPLPEETPLVGFPNEVPDHQFTNDFITSSIDTQTASSVALLKYMGWNLLIKIRQGFATWGSKIESLEKENKKLGDEVEALNKHASDMVTWHQSTQNKNVEDLRILMDLVTGQEQTIRKLNERLTELEDHVVALPHPTKEEPPLPPPLPPRPPIVPAGLRDRLPTILHTHDSGSSDDMEDWYSVGDNAEQVIEVKMKKMEPYSGERGNAARNFLEDCQLQFMSNITQFPNDRAKIVFTLGYLSGSARIWAQPFFTLLSNNKPLAQGSWVRFEKGFLQHFETADKQGDSVIQLEALKMEPYEAHVYTVEFNRLVSEIRGYGEEYKKAIYRKGLCYYLKKDWIGINEIETLSQMQAEAKRRDLQCKQTHHQLAEERKEKEKNIPKKGSGNPQKPATTSSSPVIQTHQHNPTLIQKSIEKYAKWIPEEKRGEIKSFVNDPPAHPDRMEIDTNNPLQVTWRYKNDVKRHCQEKNLCYKCGEKRDHELRRCPHKFKLSATFDEEPKN